MGRPNTAAFRGIGRPWTEAEHTTIVDMWNAGLSLDNLAQAVDRSQTAVKDKIVKLRQNSPGKVSHRTLQRKRPVSTKIWTPVDDVELHKLLRSGITQAEIGMHFGVSRLSIVARLGALRRHDPAWGKGGT